MMQYALSNDAIDGAWFTSQELRPCCIAAGGASPYRICTYPVEASSRRSQYGPKFFAGMLYMLWTRKLSLVLQAVENG